MSVRKVIGILFLAIQVYFIINARFVDARFFCWAPLDAQSEYVLKVTVDGKILNRPEIKERYQFSYSGLDQRSIEHVKKLIRDTENHKQVNSRAKIFMKYTVNGGPSKVWNYPKG